MSEEYDSATEWIRRRSGRMPELYHGKPIVTVPYGSTKVSEEDKKLLDSTHKSKPTSKEEIQKEVKAIKEELAALEEKAGLRVKPTSVLDVFRGRKEKKGEKDVAVFPTSTE